MIAYISGKALLNLALAIALLPLGIRAAREMYNGPTWLGSVNGWLKLTALLVWLVVSILAVLQTWHSAERELDGRLKMRLRMRP